MKKLLLFVITAASALAQDHVLRDTVPNKYFGTTAPGSITGNVPGDLYFDTTSHVKYTCGAPAATAAPACTSVSTGGWEVMGGSVTSVAPGCGLGGGTITTTGTLIVSPVVKTISATSYTLLAGDCGGVDKFTGASPAVTIPTAGGSFPNGWTVGLSFTGTGTMTLTPASGTINGFSSANIVAGNGAGGSLTSDGTNWTYISGGGSGGAGITWNTQALDWSLTRISSTVVRACAGASSTTPCTATIGDALYIFTAAMDATIVTAASGLAYFYVDTTGAFTIGVPAGYTGTTCVTCTVAPSITAYPPGVFKVGIWNATANTWDSVITQKSVTSNSTRGTFSGTGGAVITQAGANVNIAVSAGASACGPMDMTCFEKTYVWSEQVFNGNGAWGFTGACSGVGANTNVTAGESYGVEWQNANCFVYYPGRDNTTTYKLKDFLSGGTPKSWTFSARYNRNFGAGDHYIGWSSGAGTISEFVGLRYSNASNKWQCVIRASSADVVSNDLSATPDTNPHTFTIINAGAANSITCQIDGGAPVSSPGTIPSNDWYAVEGTTSAVHFVTSETRLQAAGLSR